MKVPSVSLLSGAHGLLDSVVYDNYTFYNYVSICWTSVWCPMAKKGRGEVFKKLEYTLHVRVPKNSENKKNSLSSKGILHPTV